jgi:hypothetical protein
MEIIANEKLQLTGFLNLDRSNTMDKPTLGEELVEDWADRAGREGKYHHLPGRIGLARERRDEPIERRRDELEIKVCHVLGVDLERHGRVVPTEITHDRDEECPFVPGVDPENLLHSTA